MALTGDGERLAASKEVSGKVTLWETDSGEKLRTFEHGVGIRGVALSGDGRRLATWSNKKVILWDSISGVKLRTLSSTPQVSAQCSSLATASGPSP